MDRIKCLRKIFVFCYLGVLWADCKPSYLRQIQLLQGTAALVNRHVLDHSHTRNVRQVDPALQPGQGHLAVGQDQTDQNLQSQSNTNVGNAQRDIDSLHASDGHLVGHLQNGDSGHHRQTDLGHDQDSAVQGQSHDALSDTSAHSDSDGPHNAPIQDAIYDHDSSVQKGQIMDSINGLSSSDVTSNGVLNHLDSAQDTHYAILDSNQQSSVEQHSDTVSGMFDDTPQTGNGNSDVADDDDYDVDDDYVLPNSAGKTNDVLGGGHSSEILGHSDAMTDHGSAIPAQGGSLTDHDSAVPAQGGSMTDHGSAIPAQGGSLTDHDSAIPPRHGSMIDHDSAIPSHRGSVTDHDSAIPTHSGSMPDHDSAISVNHDNSLSHNDGMILDSHNANNGSAVVVSHENPNDNRKDVSGHVISGDPHLPVQNEHHSEGSGSSPSGNNNGSTDHRSGHENEHNTGLLLDSEFGHLDGQESLNGHRPVLDGQNPDLAGHIETPDGHQPVRMGPDTGVLDHDGGASVPDIDHIHVEGSGSHPDSGSEPVNEQGSGLHGLIPGHDLPPSHEGHEAHPDTLPGSGDGTLIDKDGGAHENQETEHGQPHGPRHTQLYTASTTPAVKIIILPTPVEPELVDHSRTTPGSHGGDEIEGSGSEGQHVTIVTTRSTHAGEGHEGEGHIVAVTTTHRSHHEYEGSGSGIGSEGQMGYHEGHTGGHEGEGHLPGEGSGQEPEGHEGAVNATGDKTGKQQNKGTGPKHSAIIFPSEGPHLLQPSTATFPVSSSRSSINELVTETQIGHTLWTKFVLSETPSLTSEGLVRDSSQTVLQSSFPTGVFGSYSKASASTFSSSSSPALQVTESSLLQTFTQASPNPRMTSQSLKTSDSSSINTFAARSSTFIASSAVIAENYFTSSQTSSSPKAVTTRANIPSAGLYPSQVSRLEPFSETLPMQTVTIGGSASHIGISEAFSSTSSSTPSLSSSTASELVSSAVVSAAVGGSSLNAGLNSLSRGYQQAHVTTSIKREDVSPSTTQSSYTSVLIRPKTTNTPEYSVYTEPTSSVTTKIHFPSSPPTSNVPTTGTVTTSTGTRLSTIIHSYASRQQSRRTVAPIRSVRTMGFTRSTETVTNVKTVFAPVTTNRTTISISSYLPVVRLTTTPSHPTVLLNQPSSSETQPSSRKSSLSSLLLTTLLSTTKRKNVSFNLTVPTTPSTTKKPSSPTTKGPDKPETITPASTPWGGSTRNFRNTSTGRQGISERTTLAPIHEVRPSLSSASPTSPPVYVEVELRMTWTEFCSKKMFFIADLREIIHTEKQVLVSEERFKISNLPPEFCRMVERHLMTSRIKIQVYIMNDEGGVDVRLTMDLSTAIEKDFRTLSSEFKDKFVRAKLFLPSQVTTAPSLDSPVQEVPKSPGITMVTVIASVGGACCVILIILQVLIRRRIVQKKARPYVWGQRTSLQSLDHVALGAIPKSRPDSGYWNPALEAEEIPEPSPQSHLVNFAGLANFSLDKNGIYEEFQMIPFETPEKSEVPIGVEEKNRFANVLPFKSTRVRLEKKEGADNSDYINANFIKGYKKAERTYIATQSPMINTAENFWRMVWEQQSRVILMLNPLNDTGKPKMCTMYWPDSKGSECVKQFGDYAVTLLKKDVQQDYIETTLQLRDMERNLRREIHHFWFTTWPETGLPEPLAFVKFILDTRPRYEGTGAPVVVHCGPGTGRTGVLIAADVCMRMFEEKRRVDVLQCVHQMRRERAGSVQTRDQYALIYQALSEYAVILGSPSMSTRSSVITLHAML